MAEIQDATKLVDVAGVQWAAEKKLRGARIDSVGKYRIKTVSQLEALGISDGAIESTDKALAAFNIFRPDSEIRKLYERPITLETRFDEIVALRGGTSDKLARLGVYTVQDYLGKTDKALLEPAVRRKGLGERHLGQFAIKNIDKLLEQRGHVRGKSAAQKPAESFPDAEPETESPLTYPHLHVPRPIDINPILNSTAYYAKLLMERRCLPESDAILNRIIQGRDDGD